MRRVSLQFVVVMAAVALCAAAPASAGPTEGVAEATKGTPSAPDSTVPAAPAPTAPGYTALPKVQDASTKAKSEGADYDPKVLDALEAFCAKWMGFLAVRERDNRTKIKWESAPVGVRGTFIGYSPDYECKLKKAASAKATPVATIKYLEFLYQQEGPTNAEAAITAPRVVEATEVLEIFRYAGGKWVY